MDVIRQATTVRTICEAMNKGPYKVMLEEIHKLLRLYFTIPITSSSSERAFSTLRIFTFINDSGKTK